MKKLFVLSILLVSSLVADEAPSIAGVWEAENWQVKCVCGHASQLTFSKAGETETLEVNEFCLDHKSAASLGSARVTKTHLEFGELDRSLKYTLSQDGGTLSLVGDTMMGKFALKLNRIDGQAFYNKLSKISAAELFLSRSSMLFPVRENFLPDPKNPFAPAAEGKGKQKAEEAEQKAKK